VAALSIIGLLSVVLIKKRWDEQDINNFF
jgi:hypothetical protein